MQYKDLFQRFIFTPNRRTAVLAALVAVGVGVIFFNIHRQPPDEWRRATAGGEGLTVMTFNVLLGGKPAGPALDAMEAAAADVVCLQEMTPQLADAFKARLGKRYPHRYFKPGRMTQGVGIASRYPLSDGEVLKLGLNFLPAVAATVRTKSGAVRVACVHLMPAFARFRKSVGIWSRYWRNEGIRVNQARLLLNHLKPARRPTIILGDMNEMPRAAAMSVLAAAGFTDACHGSRPRCGPTWPGRFIPFPATFRVDHILGRGVTFADAAVLEAGGSDHYPVVARVIVGTRKIAEGNVQ